MNKTLDWQILRYVGYGLVFLIGVYLLYLVRGTLPIFLMATLFAYALEPSLQRLERRGYSRRAAVGFVFLVFLLLLACMVALLASAWQQGQALAENFPTYQAQAIEFAQRFRGRVEASHLTPDVKQSIVQAMDNAQGRSLSYAAGLLQSAPAWVLGSLGTFFLLLFVLPLITLWLMLEMNPLRARLLMLVPPLYRRDVTEIGQSINALLGRYVRGQMIVCGLYGLLCTMAFYVLSFRYGMGYPLVLGLLAGLIYIVPYLGPATVLTAAGLTGYFTSNPNQHVACAVAAVSCCIVFNLIIDYGIAPRVLGKGVGLHPLMVIFALLSGAQVGGIAGMILAVPVCASLRVVLIYLFPQLTAPIPATLPESDGGGQTNSATAVLRQTHEAEESALPGISVHAPPLAIEPAVPPLPLKAQPRA
jgi:predicted PurR-regulated permease PerM